MHQAVGCLPMQQRPSPQPVQQLVYVGRGEHLVQGVLPVRLALPRGDRQQVQVVVAQHRDGRVAQLLDETKRVERVGSPVDQIAGEPEPVRGGIEGELIQ